MRYGKRKVNDQRPKLVRPRVHVGNVAPGAVANKQGPAINIILATGLRANEGAASLSNRREITTRARTCPPLASPENCLSAYVRMANGV